MPLGRTMAHAVREGYRNGDFTALRAMNPHHLYLGSYAPGITDAGGGAVSQWNDLSDNARHVTQSTAGQRPTTGTRTSKGRNMIDFDGGDMLTLNTTVNYNLTNFTEFFLMGQDADKVNCGIIGFHNGSGNDYDGSDRIVFTTSDSVKLFEPNYANGPSGGAIAGAGATPFDMWTTRKQGADLSNFRGYGTTRGYVSWTNSTGTANSGVFVGGRYIGGAYNTGNSPDGPMGIILGFTRALNWGEITRVWDWIRAHYGYPQ